MVYPFYCLLLTVSATGIPSALASLTAERIGRGESVKPLLKTSLRLFLLIGFFGSILMCALAPVLSKAQGERLSGSYLALAPSVFLVSAISVFRGYFQCRNRMTPTALSEILEQVVKVGFGLLFAYLYRGNPEKAVTFLLFAVTISELFALLFMLVCYQRNPAPMKNLNEGGRVEMKRVLRRSIPVTFHSALIPLSGLIDSVLVVRLLEKYATNAVTLFGLFSGGAVTVINLPVSVCYGIAAASIPAVGKCGGEGKSPKKRVLFALFVTLAVSVPSALGLFLFAEPAVGIVFRALKGEEKTLLVKPAKLFSVSAITLSATQTLSACLTAQGKPKYAALAMTVAVAVKIPLTVWLVKKPSLHIFGAAIAANVCYLLAFALDLLYNFIVINKKIKERKV
jgi:stage V sporulation protein B